MFSTCQTGRNAYSPNFAQGETAVEHASEVAARTTYPVVVVCKISEIPAEATGVRSAAVRIWPKPLWVKRRMCMWSIRGRQRHDH